MTTYEFENYDGVKMPAEFHLFKERLKRLKVRNEDVWVTSYPKAGTTWCQELVWLIGNDLDYEGAKVNLDLRFPFIEFNSFVDEVNRFCKKYNLRGSYAKPPPDYLKLVEESSGRRYIKTHLPWEFLPEEIVDGTKTPKVIHVMRNPKQIATSYYNHAANVYPLFLGSLEEFVDLYIKGGQLHGDYFRNVLSYWKRRRLPNLLILTYEEMHRDIVAVIKKVSHFLGKSYSEEEIKKLAYHLSFDEMRKNLSVNRQGIIKSEKIHFIREGATDSYKKELSDEMIKKLDEWVFENAKGTDLPYENC